MTPGKQDSRQVIIGQIKGLYGVRGGLKVFSFTHPRERIFTYQPWLLKIDTSWVAWQVSSFRNTGKGLVVFLENISDREHASSLVGVEIAVERNRLPQLPEDEYYWTDLIDLEVIDMQGRSYGLITGLQETGANDVLVVQGERKNLIPWVKHIIKHVDLEAGRVYVDWNPEYQ